MITSYQLIERAPLDTLYTIKDELYLERARLDKWFTIFLDQHEDDMNEETNTPVWAEYHQRWSYYEEVANAIKLVEAKIDGRF